MSKMKLLLLDDWLKAIQKLIGYYNSDLNPSDISCPLCRVSRMEKYLSGRNPDDVDDMVCCCPWVIFELDVTSCYTIALRQSKEERIARLKGWQKRILHMKRRRK